MKALSIIQPFAELIACGAKRVENRAWVTGYRGRLAIHAGKSQRYGARPVADIAVDYGIDPANLIFGAIVAVAELVDCVQIYLDGGRRLRASTPGAESRHPWLLAHAHTSGPICFVLENVRRLPTPLLCRGQQGLFDVDSAAIERAMAGKVPDLAGQRLARTLGRM